MNISYNWLKKYIDIDMSAEEIAETLTSIGLEVGSVEQSQSIRGGLEGLVVGKVLTCEQHPNADKLHVTTVDVGLEAPLDIVCGAPNVAAGQKVVVATIGTVLYDGDQSFTIKPSKLRGVASNGMLCAADEIGIGHDHSGIIVLPDDVAVGTLAKDYYNVETDTIIEVDITPNRIDAASHYGVARDLAAAVGLMRNDFMLTRPSVEDFRVDNHKFEIDVKVQNVDACPRYSGVCIDGVTVGESPEWLRKALISIGHTPINNIVDVTNYVLFAFGQPMHAFDGAKIKGNKIIVRNVEAGTKFTTLDGKERTLHQDDILVCNVDEPMCLGGIFGGLDSGVTEKTTKIFLESAWFNPVVIRKTARRQQLSTDASFRFERGTDPDNNIYALKYAAMLIKEVAGGTISSNIVDYYPVEAKPYRVGFNLDRCCRLMGKNIRPETVKKILKSLEIEVSNEDGNDWVLRVPRYRVDVTREADVIEDVLRIYGYNNIEMPSTVRSTVVYAPKPDYTKLTNKIANQLVSVGFQEIMCNTLTKASYFENQPSFPKENTVLLANPLSSDLSALRQTLLFGALESARHNRNRKNPDLKFFEIGNCQSFSGGDKTDLKNYRETRNLSLLMTGLRAEANWNTPAQSVSFFDLKSVIDNLLTRLGINRATVDELPLADDVYTEGIALMVDKNKVLCKFGLVSGKLCKQFDIDVPVYFAEMNLALLIEKSAKQNKILFAELPKYPEVKRDLALLVDKGVTFAELRKMAFNTEKKLLKSVSLFDVYEGKNLPEGKKSYALSFMLADADKTLEDKQIEKIMNSLIGAFKHHFGAELR